MAIAGFVLTAITLRTAGVDCPASARVEQGLSCSRSAAGQTNHTTITEQPWATADTATVAVISTM